MFQDNIIRAKGHSRGLITDGKDYPENSVQDVLNLDLNATWDERRSPITDVSGFTDPDIPTLAEKLANANLKIIGIYEKALVDYAGDKRDVKIVVVKDTVTYKIKILTNYSYNPTTDFGNSHDGALGWVEGWYDLTEAYYYYHATDYPLAYLSTIADPKINTYRITSALGLPAYVQGKVTDYFNGWFLYDLNDICIGQIKKFTNAGGGVYDFDIGMNSVASGGSVTAYGGTSNITGYYICKFPFNKFAYNQINNISSDNTFQNITEVDFEETYNSVKICIGKEFRPVRITFLQNKTFWKDGTIPVKITGISKANPMVVTVEENSGILAGEKITIKDVIGMTEVNGNTYTVSSVSGSGNSQLSIAVNSTGYTTYVKGGKAYPDNTDSFKRSWSGFWLSYDIPKIENIESVIKYETGDHANLYYDYSELGREMGCRIKADFLLISLTAPEVDDYYKDAVVGMCLTLDGYQTIFIKYFIGGKHKISTTYTVYQITTEIQYLVDFDRRITDCNWFADTPDTTPTVASGLSHKELQSFQLDADSGGIIKTNRAAKNGTLNYYRNTETLFVSNIADNGIPAIANGISLNSVINLKFYQSPVSSFRFMFRVGNNIIGSDISSKYLETDSRIKDNYGYSKIIVSNIQFQGTDGTPVNADSCFGEGRIRHLIQGEKLTAGTGTIGNRFLLFTDQNLFYYELEDEQKLRIRENYEKYLFKGTYGLKTVCKAQVGGQFAGVYWLANDSIYRFLDNKPEDILINRWKETYQLLSVSIKSAAVTGFNARTKDVFFQIDDKIYVWNIILENWKIYKYYDTPECMITANSGDLYFTKNQSIFKTEDKTVTLRTDASTGGSKSIPFKLRKRITHGTQIANKIPDRVDMIFDIESPDESDELTSLPVNLKLDIGKNGSFTNLLSKIFSVTNKFKKSILAALRVRANYYDVTVSSDSANEDKITVFKLHELNINGKLGARDITKI